MYTASCDFCKGDQVSRKVVPHLGLEPENWLVWRVLVRGHPTKFDRLMCERCQEERSIVITKYPGPSIGDVVLDEIADGIRDIVQDEVGEVR